MGGSIGRILGNTYFKLIFGGVVIVSCVAGGLYLGDALVRQPAKVNGPAELAPSLSLGDVFPLVNYTEANGIPGSFESLLMGHKTIVLFLSADCSRCEDMLDLWNRELAPIIAEDVQVVVCFRDSVIPTNLARLVGPRKTVIPEKRLYQLVGLKVTPTLIGLDEYGLVVYVQPGYAEVFGRDFYNHFAMTAR